MFGLSRVGAPWIAFVIRRSTGRTSTDAAAVLLPEDGSGSLPATVAVLRSAWPAVPAAGFATTVKSAEAPVASAPTVQVTVLEAAVPEQPVEEET